MLTKQYVPFNEFPFIGEEIKYIQDAITKRRISGDGFYSRACHKVLEKNTGALKAFLTTSCSSALEMASLLADLNPGDEVIVPSFSFVTSASSFALRGAKLVFADIRPDTMNIDETKIEAAVTPRTKAIIVVHYAGVPCEMDTILDIAARHGLVVIEDAAQAIGSLYKGKACGAMGDMGCYSFHETKNISCGEGGALLITNEKYIGNAEIVWEKGTNRSNFFRGQVDKYTWVDLGSSYLPSEILAAYLYPQLKMQDKINGRRMELWLRYYSFFEPYEKKGLVRRPVVPSGCTHNAHMFYLLFPEIESRTAFIEYLKARGISAVFHYIPLHSSPCGLKYGAEAPCGLDTTNRVSDTLVRLPIYYNMRADDFERVLSECTNFFERECLCPPMPLTCSS